MLCYLSEGIRFRFPNLKKTSDMADPTINLPPLVPKDNDRSMGRIGTSFQSIPSALSDHSVKGTLLLLATGLIALATGIVVLFIDLPILFMGILSVVSIVALILFVVGTRARCSPVPSVSGNSASVPEPTPDKNLTAKSDNKQPAREFFEPYLRLTRLMGNRTDRGDALILACCIAGIAAAYIALFVDVSMVILVLSGILSVAVFLTAGIGAAFRFVPGNMEVLLPDQHYFVPLGSEHDQPDPKPECLEPSEKAGGSCLNVYWVQSPFVYIKIVRQGNLGLVYTVVDPVITAREKIVLQETYNYLREVIIFDNPEKSPDDLLKAKNVYRILRENDPTISSDRLPILNYYLQRDLSGFGLLEPLMHDPALEDISCNGENMPVFVFHRVFGSLRTSVIFRRGELNQFVLKLAQKANKQISLSTPMVDAALPDGSRVQITYSNVISTNGSSFTIRKFRADPMTPLDLIKFETYNSEILAFLWLVIEHRKSLIIAGGQQRQDLDHECDFPFYPPELEDCVSGRYPGNPAPTQKLVSHTDTGTEYTRCSRRCRPFLTPQIVNASAAGVYHCRGSQG